MLLNLAGGHFAFDVLLDIRELLYVLLWLNRRLSRQLNYLCEVCLYFNVVSMSGILSSRNLSKTECMSEESSRFHILDLVLRDSSRKPDTGFGNSRVWNSVRMIERFHKDMIHTNAL